MKIVQLVPFPGVEGGFYDALVAIARAAAERLGVDLEVVDCGRTAERIVETGKAVARRRPRPDCVLLPNYLGVAHELLPVFDAEEVDAFFVVDGLSPSDRLAHGAPRARHPRWLGELYPDDVVAGELLARLLTERARARRLVAADGKIHVGILAGDQTSAGQLRFKGWLNHRKTVSDVVQATVQYAGWDEATGREAAGLMLRRHPEITVFWSANDAMALGALAAVREAGRRPGGDVLIGGIDHLPRALRQVAEGGMAVTLGGHFLDGARALLLVHDHLRGQDFSPTSRRSLLEPVTAEVAPSSLRFFEQKAWRSIPFERYSRAHDPQAPELTLASLLQP